jgi:phospholipase C
MPPGLDNLRHIVVLMMENRSFDHMLGSLTAVNPQIDGITGQLSNPDTTGALVKLLPQAQFQGQLDPDPDHHFPAVDLQIFGGDMSAGRVANMQGFVKSYFNQQRDVGHSQKIMYYFAQVRQISPRTAANSIDASVTSGLLLTLFSDELRSKMRELSC